MEKVNIVNLNPNFLLPTYETLNSAGMDLKASIKENRIIEPGERILVPTGIKIALPVGYEAQIRPRSGLSLRKGIVAILGTIDADYRGEIGIILINLSNEPYTISPGERLAQMVVSKIEHVEWNPVSKLDETERGEGGFGSTGGK